MVWGSAVRRRQAEKLARKEAELAAREKAERETEEEQRAWEAEERATKEVKDDQKVSVDTISRDYRDNVTLVVSPQAGFEQLRKFEESLERVANLKILWTGGSSDKGSIITVSLQKPMNLISILKNMPSVENIDWMGKNIVLRLKIPTIS